MTLYLVEDSMKMMEKSELGFFVRNFEENDKIS